MPGPAQFAFMLAFNRSLTEAERDSIATQVAVENPGASPKELMAAKHAFKLKAGLEALKRKSHDEVDSSLSLSQAGMETASSEDNISLFSSLAGKDNEKVVPSSGVKVMTAQERMAYSFSLSCRLSASAQPKDSPKDSEISLLSDTGGGRHDGRFGEAVAKG